MSTRLRLSWFLTFLLACLLFGELHEQVHINVGALLCGGYGPRDFNEWRNAAGCWERQPLAWLSTAVGPLFSFVMMWVGLLGLGSSSRTRQLLGFALIFANLPLARLLTVAMGGGDELVVLRSLVPWSPRARWLLGTLLDAAIILPPLVGAWRFLRGSAWHKALTFTVLLAGPLVIFYFYVFQLLNGLLKDGVLATPWLLGTPALVLLHTALVGVLLALTWKRLCDGRWALPAAGAAPRA